MKIIKPPSPLEWTQIFYEVDELEAVIASLNTLSTNKFPKHLWVPKLRRLELALSSARKRLEVLKGFKE